MSNPTMPSSSSSVILDEKYDVFLSFRGEDTRNFASHLYARLCDKQISTFFDEEGLKKGDDISPALSKAIEESKISVIIFSENYASSTWCLDELVKILECRESNNQMVVPVFYQVDPSDLGKQTGSIGDAFLEHEKRFDKMPERVQRWRAALTKASKISGWDSMVTRLESKLVDGIVSVILEKLKYDVSPSSDSEILVGMEERFERIKSLLSDFQFVGIWGMGGIGKTTIAKFVCKQISPHFEGYCFIDNVRTEIAKQGTDRLKEQFLSAVLGEKIGTFHLINTSNERRLLRKKVLIVLDDVDDFIETEKIIGGLKFSLESRVVITSRDRQVLCQFGGITVYEVKELHEKHALKLFSNYAFKQSPKTKDLWKLSNKIISYVKGHPLALKVLGSSLCGKSKQIWESALDILNDLLNPTILEILKISYNSLSEVQKSIFLDIACFFKCWDFGRVTKILDSCYKGLDYNLNVLIDKSLISKTKGNEVEMHDLLQEMAWNIESTQEHHNRIWNHEDAIQVLKNNNGLEEVHGLFLDLSKSTDAELSPDAFRKMSKLKFLNFYVSRSENGVDISSVKHFNNKLQKIKYLSNELRYLHWYGCPSEEFSSTFSPENLVELALPCSKLKKIWKGRKSPSQLVSIDLHDSEWLTVIPDLSDAVHLEVINLQNCKRLASLHSLHQYLSKLGILGLVLEKFLGPKILPTNICKFNSLKKLKCSGCSNLKISDDLCFMPSLEVLDLSRTNIQNLPLNLKQLSKLRKLKLIDCHKLQLIPDLPPKLRKLLAMNCRELRSLPSFPGSREGVDASCYQPPLEYHLIDSSFIFTNCWKLNENAIMNFLAATQLSYQHLATKPLRLGYRYQQFGMAENRLCLPGTEIPDWISHQSWGSSLTIDLSQYRSDNAFIGFILCAVAEENVEGRVSLLDVVYDFSDTRSCFGFKFHYWVLLGSDHLFLMCCPYFRDKIIGGKYNTLILEFQVDGQLGKMKCCGACPVYLDAKETQPNIFIENHDFGEKEYTKISETEQYSTVVSNANSTGFQ